MSVLSQLRAAPRSLALYTWLLLGATVSDPALITLAIFSILLGFVTTVLIAATAFFGLYFFLRLVANVADAIGYSARSNAFAQAERIRREQREQLIRYYGNQDVS